MLDLSDLPDELQGGGPAAPASQEDRQEDRDERLARLGATMAKKRDDAIKARKESGIEDVWMACEEAYLGIDDANRGEFKKAKWAKPTSMAGPVTSGGARQSGNKSTAFVRLTTRYVDMGAAKISEITLPIDDKAFSFDGTPDPDLVTPLPPPAAPGMAPPATPAAAIMADPAAAAGQPAQPVPPAAPAAPPVAVDPLSAAATQANGAAKKAEKRIYDWMVESRYPMQMRKVIHDSARIGVGVLKGPFPDQRKSKAWSGGKLKINTQIAPGCKWIDPWNFFPSGSCGEDIHSGDGAWERDFLSAGGLKALAKQKGMRTPDFPDGEPIYLAAQIDKVIAEGPEKCNTEGANPNQPQDKHRFQIWHYTGTLNREDMELLGAKGAEELPDEVVECHAIVTLVNDSPIRASFNPLSETGNLPYRTFPWSRRAGHWAGVGVGEQVALPQRMVNAGTRGWMNNAGAAAGVQIVMDQRAIIGSDGNNDLTPNKLWYLTGESVQDDVRKMFMAVEFPDLGASLKTIVDYAFKLAEEASNIPLISQGQTGPQDPQTFGQAELQNSNANTLLRDKAYSLDDFITEPLVQDFYEWMLLDPDVPDDEKGDFRINARGSSAMVEKAIQEQTLAQMLPLSLNPAWGQDPKKMMAEFLRAKRINPVATAYTEAELAQMQGQPPPKSPQEKVAEINAAAKLHGIDMVNQAHLQEIAQDAQTERQDMLTGGVTPHAARAMAMVDTAHIRAISAENIEASRAFAERERAQKELEIAQQNGQFKIQELQLQKEIALLQYSTQQKISLDDTKAQLAKSAMDNQTKRELAAAEIQLAQSEGAQDRAVDLHKHHNPPPSLVRDEVTTPATP